MEEVYSSADLGIGLFITIGILIFRFVLKQSKKKSQVPKAAPQASFSDYSSTSEEAIAQMLGEYSRQDDEYDDDEDDFEEEPSAEEPIEVPKQSEFRRDTHYRIHKKEKSVAASLLDSSDELRRAVILQEIVSPPLSKRNRRS